jgi:hypothetical protein
LIAPTLPLHQCPRHRRAGLIDGASPNSASIIDKPQLLFELNYPLFNVFERFFVANYQGNLQVRCKLGFDFCTLIIHPEKTRPTAEKFQRVGWSVLSDKAIGSDHPMSFEQAEVPLQIYIRHRPADDAAAVQIHDGGKISQP